LLQFGSSWLIPVEHYKATTKKHPQAFQSASVGSHTRRYEAGRSLTCW
jgi:hypothetical protein